MSTTTFIAVAMMIVLASIVYECTIISRFITEQSLNVRVNRPTGEDENAR